MRDEIANLVHPVLRRALDLRQRLLAGEEPSFEVEQAALINLLGGEHESRRLLEYGGELRGEVRAQEGQEGYATSSSHFLGARYALVSWLDELFIIDSPWSQRWNEYKLEVRLYSSNDRAWKFWEQAKLAA